MLLHKCKKLSTIAIVLGICLTSLVNVIGATRYSTPLNSAFKAYMGYHTITSTTSKQYALQRSCYTNELGIRMYNGRYCVAIGTGYNAPVGTYIDVTLTDNTLLHCIVGDIKSDVDTKNGHKQCKHNNSVIEFIVDSKKLDSSIKSHGSAHAISYLSAPVCAITTYSEEDVNSPDWIDPEVPYEVIGQYQIADKYTIEAGDETMYFVEVVQDSRCNTREVSKFTYDLVEINAKAIL